ncbi:hypothetical protein GCM10009802_20330 [Streptomyces synnematoformans]|uniref:HK97 gp10 family phage protein n=1 Tax=Streptomyces synnematoformans TaxID=415721 RepID=A0ABN2XXR0_9ACTN
MARGQTVVAVEGGRELRRRLRDIDGGLEDLKTQHRWVARYVTQAALPGTPRRTGRLASTGRASGTKTASIVRFGRASVPYAGPIHYGWPARHIPAHPWVIDAAQRTEPVWRGHFEDSIRTLVERTPGS